MKFVVSRTSMYGGDESPCEGAVLERLERVDNRVKPAREIPGGEAGFLSAGRAHKLLEATCSRLMPTQEWVVDGDILEFIAKHGQCVVSPPGCDWQQWEPPLWSVEIYDCHRE